MEYLLVRVKKCFDLPGSDATTHSWKICWHLVKNKQWCHAYKCWNAISSTTDTFCRNVILYVHVKIWMYLLSTEMLSWGLGCIYRMSENCETFSNQCPKAQNTQFIITCCMTMKSNNPSFSFLCQYVHHLSSSLDHTWKQSRFIY